MRSMAKKGFLLAAAVSLAAAGTAIGLAQGRGGATMQQAPPQRTLVKEVWFAMR